MLSGHIGGANALTDFPGCRHRRPPIVTTATDVEGKFSVDAWAKGQGLHIGSMAWQGRVRHTGGDVPICAVAPCRKSSLPGLVKGEEGKPSIRGHPCPAALPANPGFDPKVLTLGLGCRKNTPEAIEALVSRVLAEKAFPGRPSGGGGLH